MISINEQAKPNKGLRVITDDAKKHIIDTLDKQNKKGVEKYGMLLETFNGRDSIRDIWEEAGDFVNYLEALTQEYAYMREILYNLYDYFPDVKKYVDEDLEPAVRKFIRPY